MDLLTSASTQPATWHVRETDSHAALGYWKINGVTLTSSFQDFTEGVAATTPVPTAAWIAASAATRLANGPYTFEISYTDAAGSAGSAVSLIVTPVARAITIGDNDDAGHLNTLITSIAAWNASSGDHFYFATGMNRLNRQTDFGRSAINWPFTSPVILTWQDTTRPGGLTGLRWYGANNLIINDITVTGNVNGTSGFVAGFALIAATGLTPPVTTTNVTMNRDGAVVAPQWTTSASSMTALTMVGASHVTINDFNVDNFYSGISGNDGAATTVKPTGPNPTPNDHIIFNRLTMRHISNNFIFMGSSDDVQFTDARLMAPKRINGTHVDFQQTVNGATPVNWTLKRVQWLMADGSTGAQGLFAGAASGAAGSGPYKGYIDDGTGTGTAGNILTITQTPPIVGAAQYKAPWVPLATVVGDTLSVVASGTRIAYLTSASGFGPSTSMPLAPATYALLGPAQVVGSPASPVNLYSAPFLNTNVDGMVFASEDSNAIALDGLSASTLKHFTQVKNFPSLSPTFVFTGTITHPGSSYILTLTSASVLTNAAPGTSSFTMTYPGVSGLPVLFTGQIGSIVTITGGTGFTACPNIGCTWKLSTAQTLGTYSFQASFDFPNDIGPWLRMSATDVSSIYSGANTISYSYTGDVLTLDHGLPASFTLDQTDNFAGNSVSYAVQANSFAAGDPTINAVDGTHTQAIWAAMTPAQVSTAYAVLLAPKPGITFTGSLTSGSPNMTVANCTGLNANTFVSGPGIPPSLTSGSRSVYIVSCSGVTAVLSANANANEVAQTYATGMMNPDGSYNGAYAYDGSGNPVWNGTVLVGTIANGSNQMTVVSGPIPAAYPQDVSNTSDTSSPVYPTISGPGFATPPTITGVSGSVLTLSATATGAQTAQSYGIPP